MELLGGRGSIDARLMGELGVFKRRLLYNLYGIETQRDGLMMMNSFDI